MYWFRIKVTYLHVVCCWQFFQQELSHLDRIKLHVVVCCSFLLQSLQEELSRLDSAKVRLESAIAIMSRDNNNLRPLVNNATWHAGNLTHQANVLEG